MTPLRIRVVIGGKKICRLSLLTIDSVRRINAVYTKTCLANFLFQVRVPGLLTVRKWGDGRSMRPSLKCRCKSAVMCLWLNGVLVQAAKKYDTDMEFVMQFGFDDEWTICNAHQS